MAYGGSSYGSNTYGGEVGANPLITLDKSARYAVITTPDAKQKSAGYTVNTPHLIQKGAQYGIISHHAPLLKDVVYMVISPQKEALAAKYTVISPRAAILRSAKYAIISPHEFSRALGYDVFLIRPQTKGMGYYIDTRATAIQKSSSYIVAIRRLLQKSAQYGVLITKAPLSMYMQYVVIIPTVDVEDYSKNVIISSHTTFPVVLWNGAIRAANDFTAPTDVSKYGVLGYYIQTNTATTINIQAQTPTSLDGSGWSTVASEVFSAAGATTGGIWFMAFQNIRFQTTAAATITIQAFLRT